MEVANESKPDQVLRLKDVMNLTRMSKTSIYRLMQEAAFPPSTQVQGRGVAFWSKNAVDNWIQENILDNLKSSA